MGATVFEAEAVPGRYLNELPPAPATRSEWRAQRLPSRAVASRRKILRPLGLPFGATQHWGRSYRKCLFWEITIVKRASVLGLIVLQNTEPAVAFKDRQFHVLDIFHALLAQLRVELFLGNHLLTQILHQRLAISHKR